MNRRDVCLETCPRRLAFSQITRSSRKSLVLIELGALWNATGIVSLAAVSLTERALLYAVTLITDTRRVL
jgi:hypothetical protein